MAVATQNIRIKANTENTKKQHEHNYVNSKKTEKRKKRIE